MQRGAEYMESWLAGTQPIQERPKVNFMKPRTMTEIVAADVLVPDFGSAEWMDFASSFAQALKVANKPPKRKDLNCRRGIPMGNTLSLLCILRRPRRACPYLESVH